VIIEFAVIGCGLLYLCSIRLRRENDKIIDDFAKELMSCNERLGPEFEEVLYENLWELYQE